MRHGAVAVFVRRQDWPGPRVVRMMTVARRLGLQVLFVGARRDCVESTASEPGGFDVERIGRPFRRFHGRGAIGYLFSVVGYSVSLFRFLWKVRPALVHASDFEVYGAARLYASLTGAAVMYNIHDNLALRYRCAAIGRWCLNVLEGLAARWATVALVPELHRRDALPKWSRSRVVIARNAPIDPGFSAPSCATRVVSLLYAGRIDTGRGIRQLARLAGHHQSLKLRVAGAGDQDLVAEMIDRDRVTLLGRISHDDALQETRDCDFVCALYDPDVPINRYAASNKVAEALAIGRPVVINREVEIVSRLEQYGCLVVVDWHRITRSSTPRSVWWRYGRPLDTRRCAGARGRRTRTTTRGIRVEAATTEAYRRAGVRVTHDEGRCAANPQEPSGGWTEGPGGIR